MTAPWTLHAGDCRAVLPTLADNSVDAVMTDPPAGIGFMGLGFDSDRGGRAEWVAWLTGIVAECLRVLKPGGHAFVWALPRTAHWTAWALEDAGFQIRDVVHHIHSQGFPKNLDIGKALDKAAGVEREVVGVSPTDLARHWDGWGTALKPAVEHWILCRKPFKGNVADNVAQWGTGAVNVDACRVPGDVPATIQGQSANQGTIYGADQRTLREFKPHTAGRWPSNLIHDGSDEVLAEFAKAGERSAGSPKTGNEPQSASFSGNVYGNAAHVGVSFAGYGDTGSAARFFKTCEFSEADTEHSQSAPFVYVPKASTRERNEGLPDGMRSGHPTVKPIALCRYLCRLITPPGGLVLDPFAGSASIGCGAILEGFQYVGIEMDPEYVTIAEARLRYWAAQPRQIGLL